MASTPLELPRTDFSTSGGNVAEDQFCQDIELAIPSLTVIECSQDFVKVTLVFDVQPTVPDLLEIRNIAQAHTAVGRITEGAVIQLCTGLFENEEGYATDGRKEGEPAAGGTGVPIYWSTAEWRVFSTDLPVQT